MPLPETLSGLPISHREAMPVVLDQELTFEAPEGGATEAKQDTQITAEQAILAKLTSDPATQTTLAAALAILGATNGAKVITDANGTLQQYLRGLVSLWISGVAASENHIGQVGGHTLIASANFTRPSDTTAYASGDLVANSTTAGSVVPMSFTVARVNSGSGLIRRARIKKTNTVVTNAQFRLHLYATDPAASSGITNGDNGAWLTKIAGYLGTFDVTVDKVFSDASVGNGTPLIGSEINFVAQGAAMIVYGLLEARAAYTPASAEVFTVELESIPN